MINRDRILTLCHDANNLLLGLMMLPEGEEIGHLLKQIIYQIQETHILTQAIDNHAILKLFERQKFWIQTKNRMEKSYALSLEMTMDVTPECAVYSNIEQANQVTQNLIANAAAAGAKKVRIHYREEEDIVTVVFQDDGHGLTADEINNLGFATRVKLPHGVDIVRDLINSAGGTVEWTSEPGLGTKVKIKLRKVIQ